MLLLLASPLAPLYAPERVEGPTRSDPIRERIGVILSQTILPRCYAQRNSVPGVDLDRTEGGGFSRLVEPHGVFFSPRPASTASGSSLLLLRCCFVSRFFCRCESFTEHETRKRRGEQTKCISFSTKNQLEKKSTTKNSSKTNMFLIDR